MAPEPEGSSPYSQEPATGPCPESTVSNLHSPQPIFLTSILIPSFHLRLGLPSGHFPSDFPHQNPVHFTLLSHACHMSRPPHSPSFDLPNDILGWVQALHCATYSVLPSPYPTLVLFSNTLSLCSSLSVRDQVSHPYKTTGRIMVLYILTFTFLEIKRENKRLWTKQRQAFLELVCS
jgi:hypothetical protein